MQNAKVKTGKCSGANRDERVAGTAALPPAAVYNWDERRFRSIGRSFGMKKQEVLELLDQFPNDDVDNDRLMHELYLKIKLERAEAAVAAGQLVAHDEAVRRSQEWFK